jgi:hypothetical protein
MNRNRITATVAVVALAGLIHALGPQNSAGISLDNNVTPALDANARQPAADASAPTGLTPLPVSMPSGDPLLSEMKVYPSF